MHMLTVDDLVSTIFKISTQNATSLHPLVWGC